MAESSRRAEPPNNKPTARRRYQVRKGSRNGPPAGAWAARAGGAGGPEVLAGATTMQRSQNRILTTHAGSLPRPAGLTSLFAKRIRGEAVDPARIEAEGRAALRAVVKQQIETGLDVIDDGEQSREAVVLSLRDRP